MKQNLLRVGAFAAGILLSGAVYADCVPDAEHSGDAAFHFHCKGSPINVWVGFLDTSPGYGGNVELVVKAHGIEPLGLTFFATGATVPCNNLICNPEAGPGVGQVPAVQGIARGALD